MPGSTGNTGYEPRLKPAPRTLLRRLREIMAKETDAQTRLNQLVETIAVNMVADVCSIYVRRPDDILELFATEGLKRDAIHNTRLTIEEGLVGWVARNRRPLLERDAKTNAAFSYRAETGEDPLNAFLGVPIIRSGQVLGVLVIQNRAKRSFNEDEVEVAQIVATVLAEIVSTGELLDERDRQDVEAVLHKPEHAIGTPIVEGVVRGVAFRLDPQAKAHPTFASDVAAEQRRLEDAIMSMQKSVDDMIAKDQSLSGSTREVLEVFRLFAYDKGWRRRMVEKVLAGLSAETAVEQVQAENRKRMREVTDPYLRERFHDLEDLTRRLLRALTGESARGPSDLPENAVLLATSLGPAELLEFHSPRLKGVIVAEAATASHAAIVARSLGVPMVGGLNDIVDQALNGDPIFVNGATGDVHLRPPESVVEAFDEQLRLRSEKLATYRERRDEPAITIDGRAIELQMNAGLLLDMAHLEETGAQAVGLFRTELQFLLGRGLPTAAAQESFYRQVLDSAGGKPIIFRTADIGSDKRADYMRGPREANPAMGWRGLRMSLDREGLMRTQIRALLSAARGRSLSFMFPLVTTQDELIAARALVDKEMERHLNYVGPLPSSISIGAMIEIPSAAWDAKGIASHADFVSVGGNDLAQFFFAADRETERVSRRYDPLTPSFLDFLARTRREAASTGKPVGFCGEQATDPVVALALLAIGFERISVQPSAIGPIKAMIRSLNFARLSEAVKEMIALGGGSIRQELQDFAISEALEIGRFSARYN